MEFEKRNPQYDYVSGFGSLSSFMASDVDNSPLIFRRFDKLAARDLLYYQSELSQLQLQQDEFDIQDRKDVDSSQRGNEVDHSMIRDCLQDWKSFEDAAVRPISTAHPSMAGSSHGSWKERLDLAMKIRSTLKEYREALIQQSTLLSMPHPSPQILQAISRFFHGPKISHISTMPAPAAYSVLSGASSTLYPTQMGASQIRASDYISLSKPPEPDLLTTLLQTHLSRLFRTKSSRTLPLYHSGRSQAISHLSPSEMKYYSYEQIRFAASFITTLAAAILLFVPIFALYNTSGSRPILTLGLIAMFTIIFAASLALMTTASRSEIFGACAAYSAVLVVFVSGDFAAGGGIS